MILWFTSESLDLFLLIVFYFEGDVWILLWGRIFTNIAPVCLAFLEGQDRILTGNVRYFIFLLFSVSGRFTVLMSGFGIRIYMRSEEGKMNEKWKYIK